MKPAIKETEKKKSEKMKIRRKYHGSQKDKRRNNKYYRHKYEIKISTWFHG